MKNKLIFYILMGLLIGVLSLSIKLPGGVYICDYINSWFGIKITKFMVTVMVLVLFFATHKLTDKKIMPEFRNVQKGLFSIAVFITLITGIIFK